MSVNANQAAMVKSFWNDPVSKDPQTHANEIFLNFLSAHPEEQPKFKKFATVPLGSLKGNGDFQKQALAVVKTLGGFVQVVDNEGSLKSATKAMAAQHKSMGILKANFDKIFPVIRDYIVAAGGDKGAWTACLDAIKDAITSQQ